MPRRGSLVVMAAVAGLAVAAGAYGIFAYGRGQEARVQAAELVQGDPDRAPGLMVRYGCAGCHEIPGIRGAGGLVGPPLRHVRARVYLAGRLTNTPSNLVRWITNPREVDPRTAMPVTGISPAEARHVAAYLLALR